MPFVCQAQGTPWILKRRVVVEDWRTNLIPSRIRGDLHANFISTLWVCMSPLIWERAGLICLNCSHWMQIICLLQSTCHMYRPNCHWWWLVYVCLIWSQTTSNFCLLLPKTLVPLNTRGYWPITLQLLAPLHTALFPVSVQWVSRWDLQAKPHHSD